MLRICEEQLRLFPVTLHRCDKQCLMRFINVILIVCLYFFYCKCSPVLSYYSGGDNFVNGSLRVKMKNRGTIVVLERYGLALCFLDVF